MAAKLVRMDLIPNLGTTAPVTVAGRTLAGEDLAGAAAAVARRIAGMGTVAVEATASLETVVAVVGALGAGVPVVPLPPDAGPLERSHILGDCQADAILGSDLIVDVDERADWSFAGLVPDRVAMIVYTSGTTGLPKGVVLSAAAISTDLDLLAEAWGWTADDVLAHGLPLFHVHGLVLGVLGALRVGSPLVHTGRPTPDSYAAAGGSLYFGVPTVWSRIAGDSSAAASLGRARLLVSGSAGLPVPVFEKLAQLCGQGPIERYGMTETLITVSGRHDSPIRRPGWVGTALPGVKTRLAEEADGVGELEVSTPTAMVGYLNLPAETAALHTPDGWIRTGDIASIDGDGWHQIVGRKSTDLIKSGGYRIGAGEVEAALLAHPGVAEAAVVGVPDDDLGQVIVAYVVASGVDGPALTEFVARTLSVHKRPRRVELVDELPRNAMGKVQKQLLSPLSP
jgi:fatty acid CoA ligase FadD36